MFIIFQKEFYTPEEFFLNHKAVKYEWGSIDPNEILKKNAAKNDEPKTYYIKVKLLNTIESI